MKLSAHYQPICAHAGILRIGPEGWRYPELGYHQAATIRVEGDTAVICGFTASAPYCAAARQPVAAALYEAGFDWACWEREPGGRQVKFSTARWAKGVRDGKDHPEKREAA